MRISNIKEYLGGSDDVIAAQIVQGSAKHWVITLADSNNNALDLAGYTFEYDTINATATVTPAGSSNITLTDLSVGSNSAVSRDSLVSVTDTDNGVIDLYLGADYFSGDVPFDTNTEVPVVVGTLRYSDGATEPTIRSVRTLVVVRYGVVAS